MEVKYDFNKGTIRFEYGESYNLESLRRYVLNYHEDRIRHYFIKAIRSGKKNIFTYDFDGFFTHEIDIPIMRAYKKYLENCFDDHVYPVVGIKNDPSNLYDIVGCVEKQFVVDGHDYKKLQGRLAQKDGQGKQYPLMVYVGICDMHGFMPEDSMEEASLENREVYDNLLEKFKKELSEKTRIYNKTRLVLSALRARFDKVYIHLGKIGD